MNDRFRSSFRQSNDFPIIGPRSERRIPVVFVAPPRASLNCYHPLLYDPIKPAVLMEPSMLQYFICYKGRRLRGPMTREEALAEMFELNHAFKGLSIQIVDSETNKLKGEIKPNRRKGRK